MVAFEAGEKDLDSSTVKGPGEQGKRRSEETETPFILQDPGVADTYLPAVLLSALLNCKVLKAWCFKLLNLWSFAMAMKGN